MEASTSAAKLPVDRTVDGRDAPWVEKYRPKTLDDVAAHKEIIDTSMDTLSTCRCLRCAQLAATRSDLCCVAAHPLQFGA
jgi:hypothetical protein